MGRLVYSAIASLDGYVNDAGGGFEWAMPGDDLFAFVLERERPRTTYLYGRRMYETMAVWEEWAQDESETEATRDFGRMWSAAEKVVWSRTLEGVTTSRTRLEREFDPAAVRRLVDAAPGDVSIGGATLAHEALRAGIVDDLEVYAVPAVVGGGTPTLPTGIRLDLELVETARFEQGATFAAYRVLG
ncbi:dihydrofolate reductase [Terracoccus luteus]|uniref:Dihydrofolate reductase n=1 Tax=Terracoccus luteus TaxID=53356 RepID=A0A495XY05_9MICO|nr:dihydrofolate reductase family protein [Terracoccus luteus]RKT79491.1 dihydrofolate reductase [Terracoccus luteus]